MNPISVPDSPQSPVLRPPTDQLFQVNADFCQVLALNPKGHFSRKDLQSAFIQYAIDHSLVSQDMKTYRLNTADERLRRLFGCDSFPSKDIFNKLKANGIIRPV